MSKPTHTQPCLTLDDLDVLKSTYPSDDVTSRKVMALAGQRAKGKNEKAARKGRNGGSSERRREVHEA